MIKFPAELLLSYLGELIKINPTEPYEFENPSILKDVDAFLDHSKYDWDMTGVDPLHIWELFVQEEIFNNRMLHISNDCDDPEVVIAFANRYWNGDFSSAFFDPNPNPTMALAGWINLNYSRHYEMIHDRLPNVTLHSAWFLAHLWLNASPTSDELLSEHIIDRLIDIREKAILPEGSADIDYEYQEDWLREEGCDLMYESTKTLWTSLHYLRTLIGADPDNIAHDVGLIIKEELREDYVNAVIEELGEDAAGITPIIIASNMLDVLDTPLD